MRVLVYVAQVVRAAICARISSDRDGGRLGVSRQVQDCDRPVARHDWQVKERYVDDDVSAYGGRRRPEYRWMFDDLRCGHLALRPSQTLQNPPHRGARPWRGGRLVA